MNVATSSVYAVSSVVAALPWVITRRKDHRAGRILYIILAITLLYGFILPALLSIENRLAPWKFDELLVDLDGALGASVRAFSRAMPYSLFLLFVIVYKSLLWVITLWAALHLRHSWGRFDALVSAFALSYIAAGLLYLIVPACGPAFALSGFRGSPSPMLLSCEPNAIPSMHFASALLLVLFAGPNRWMRVLSILFLFGTALGTVLAGEHYFIDWIVAIPMACFAEATVRRSFKEAIAYLAIAGMWMLLIRFVGVDLIAHPSILWVLAALTLLGGAGIVCRAWDLRVLRFELKKFKRTRYPTSRGPFRETGL